MNKESNKFAGISIHIIIWVGVFSFPFFVAYFIDSRPMVFNPRMMVMPLHLLIVFYINYLFLINKFLFRQRVWLFILINLLIYISISIFYIFANLNSPPPDRPKPDFDPIRMRIFMTFMVNLFIETLTVGLCVSIKMTGKWYEARQRVRDLEKINTQAELQQLKSQLNPHVLFNSLNNIFALIDIDPKKAQFSLYSLCDILRYQLYEANRETIPLEKEIEFVCSYCDLMRLRLAENVTLQVDLPDDCHNVMIAPLLFIPIVENSFKHAVSLSEPSFISIRISLDNRDVTCTVRNSYFPKNDTDRSGSGIGLENLRRRLELLYPHRYIFTAEKEGSVFFVKLMINL